MRARQPVELSDARSVVPPIEPARRDIAEGWQRFAKPSSSPAQDGNDVRANLLSKKAAPFLGPLLKRQSGGLIQEWRCGEPVRQPERQQERCREQQVKVIRLSAASFVVHYNALAQPKRTRPGKPGSIAFNSLQLINLSATEKSRRLRFDRFATFTTCRILHIGCKAGVRVRGDRTWPSGGPWAGRK